MLRLGLGSSAFGFRVRQPLGNLVERRALGKKLHHAFRFDRGESRNFLLNRRWERPVPRGKQSQDRLLPGAFLTAFLAALFADADEVFSGGRFFQIGQFSQ